jgi:hypothetical protein
MIRTSMYGAAWLLRAHLSRRLGLSRPGAGASIRSGAVARSERHYHRPASLATNIKEGVVKIALISIAALAATALACASKPTPVTVSGDPADRASLAGKWSGEYNSPVTGRSGSIVFNLSSSGDAANGDVVMVPRGYGKPLVRYDPAATTTPMQDPGRSQVLTIKLVRISGDSVSGVLDAYRDPQCDCPVETTFSGRLNGDSIDGTFATRGSQAVAAQTGTWRVRRNR